MRHLIIGLVLTSLLVIASAAPAFAGKPATGTLWLDGQLVRTIVPPAASPQEGRDALYIFPGEEQGAVAAVGPGDKGYHGGKWAVREVTFNTDPTLLTSEADILAAAAAGDVTIERELRRTSSVPSGVGRQEASTTAVPRGRGRGRYTDTVGPS